MGHNIHLLRLESVSHEEAQYDAEQAIEDWGHENNWRTVVGSFCEDGTISPDLKDKPDFLKTYTNRLTNLIQTGQVHEHSQINIGLHFIQIGVGLLNGKSYYDIAHTLKSSNPGSITSWQLKHLIQELAVREFTTIDNEFNIWEQEYREWELDEFGVTQLDGYGTNEANKQYIVVIDMHS